MASAVNADHADTADTASNALKLGGYDASEYMRKDEVKTIKSSYETLEWDGAGTYSWTVPEGVTKINVTTVGGGGGAGYVRVYNTSTGYYLNGFPGGNGGQVVEGTVLNVVGGDKISIVIGKGGLCAERNAGKFLDPNSTHESYGSDPTKTGNGGAGGDTYISINGIKQSVSIAKGGLGGNSVSAPYYLQNIRVPNAYHVSNFAAHSGSGKGGDIHYVLNTSNQIFGYNGGNSKYANGGDGNNSTYGGAGYSYKFTNESFTKLVEYGSSSGGGASYGAGGSCAYRNARFTPLRGGGAAHCPDFWFSDAANGYVKISYTRLYSD